MRAVELRPHEIEALSQLVLNARAFAALLAGDQQSARLCTWATIVEELLERASVKDQ